MFEVDSFSKDTPDLPLFKELEFTERTIHHYTSWVNVGNTTNTSSSGLSTVTTYYWQILAVNPYGETLANSGVWWRFTTKPPISLTASPTLVSPGQNVTASWVGLTPTGNDWISMHLATAADSSYITWQYISGASGSIVFTAASSAGDYNFRLFSNGPKIGTSNNFTVATPTAPTNLTATAVSPSQINLAWQDNSSDESNFHIERSMDGSSGWVEIGNTVAGSNSTSYNATGLNCGTKYFFRVRAHRHSDGQYSSYSNIANATTHSCNKIYIPYIVNPPLVINGSFENGDYSQASSPTGWVKDAWSSLSGTFLWDNSFFMMG